MKIQWTFVVGLIFALIIAIFATVNVDSVQVNYVFGEARWPLILIILGSVLIGFIISFCFSVFRMYGSKKQTKALQKELEAAHVLINEKDAEIVRLKNELRKRGTSGVVTEEISDNNEMPMPKK
ncbi:MAG: lipopolysaccharide assembly protein LapA domain-containing protein [Solibacillus sp.]|uniref:LapA family protein n=1 Tax=Solibacillus sp. TaxID=1909654 RepID=UPI00331630FB